MTVGIEPTVKSSSSVRFGFGSIPISSVKAALLSSVLRTVLNEVKLVVFFAAGGRQFQMTGTVIAVFHYA